MRTVEKLPSGRHKVRYRIDGKQTSQTFITAREAKQFAIWLDALGAQAAEDRLEETERDATIPTMDRLAADHIELLTRASDATKLRYSRLWARTWGPAIGHLKADRLTRDDVRRSVNQLARRYSEKSMLNQRGLLAGVCDRAVELEYLRSNPTRGVDVPRGRADRTDDEIMACISHEDWQVLYETFTAHYQPLVRFLVGTGARWGEAVALQVGDVNLPARTVRLVRALKDSPDGRRFVGTTKTAKSRRTVALPAEVLDDLVNLRPPLQERPASALVFTAPRGGMITHRTFWSDHWRPAVWRAQRCPTHGVPTQCRCGTAHPRRCEVHQTPPLPCGCQGTLSRPLRIHDLRHTHASWLLAAGVPIHVVQARLGHETIQTTVDTYGHLVPDAQLAAAQAASLAFGGSAALALPRS